MRISIAPMVSKRLGMEEVFLGAFFPRGFFQKVFDVLLDKYLREKNVTSQLDAVKALYELVYGDESQWSPSVRKRFESARLLLTGQMQSDYVVKQEEQEEEKKKQRRQLKVSRVEEERIEETTVVEPEAKKEEETKEFKTEPVEEVAKQTEQTEQTERKQTEQIRRPVEPITERKAEKREFRQEESVKKDAEQKGEGEKVDREKVKKFIDELRLMAGGFGNFGKRSGGR